MKTLRYLKYEYSNGGYVIFQEVDCLPTYIDNDFSGDTNEWGKLIYGSKSEYELSGNIYTFSKPDENGTITELTKDEITRDHFVGLI